MAETAEEILANIPWGSGVTIGQPIWGGTANEILFGDGSTNVAQSSDLFWDDALKIFHVWDFGLVTNKTYIALDDQNNKIDLQTKGTFKAWDVTSIGNDTLLTVDDVAQRVTLYAITPWNITSTIYASGTWLVFSTVSTTADSVIFSASPSSGQLQGIDWITWNVGSVTIGGGVGSIEWFDVATFKLWKIQASPTQALLSFYDGTTVTNWVIVNGTNLRIGNYDASWNSTLLTVDDTNSKITVNKPFWLQGYTVATLPAWFTWATAYVTDALLPSFLVTVVGWWAVTTPVFYNGSARVAY